MKATCLATFSIVLFAASFTGHAQVISGTQLEIGPSGSNQVSDTYPNPQGAAIGSLNQVLGTGLAVGSGNLAGTNGSVAIGSANVVLGEQSAAIGYHNTNFGHSTLTVGYFNYTSSSQEEGAPFCSVISGYANYVPPRCENVLVSGGNNALEYANTYTSHAFSATLGYGLVNKWDTSTVVGTYNDTAPDFYSGLRFAVGNGADANNRSNAFEVYADGKILMLPQGDILMGQFGN